MSQSILDVRPKNVIFVQVFFNEWKLVLQIKTLYLWKISNYGFLSGSFSPHVTKQCAKYLIYI